MKKLILILFLAALGLSPAMTEVQAAPRVAGYVTKVKKHHRHHHKRHHRHRIRISHRHRVRHHRHLALTQLIQPTTPATAGSAA